MELYDTAIIQARAALADAHKREPADLTRDDLVHQNTDLRRYLKWAIQVADDAADVSIDEESPTQLMNSGGYYIAPTDLRTRLCTDCLRRLPDR